MTCRYSDAIDRRNFLKGAAAGLIFLPNTDLSALGARRFARTSAVAVIRTTDRKDGVARHVAPLPRGTSWSQGPTG